MTRASRDPRASRPHVPARTALSSGASAPAATPRRHRLSLRATLVILLVSTVAVLCLLVGAVTHVSVRGQLEGQLDAQLTRAAHRAGGTGGPGAPDGPTSGEDGSSGTGSTSGTTGTSGTGADEADGGDDSGDDGATGPGGGEFELAAILVDGRVVSAAWRDTDGQVEQLGASDSTEVADVAKGLDSDEHADVKLSIGQYRVMTATDASGAVIVTGLPLTQVHSTLTRLDITLVTAGLLATALCGVAGSLIVRRTLRPLEEVSAVAGRVADMPLSHGDVALGDRVDERISHSGTEAGEVGRALNLLLDNVEGALETRQHSEESMRRFIADASHELRTPLTAIRGYSEMLRMTEDLSDRGEQSVDRMDAQSRRMTSLVEDLLLLARLDEGARDERTETDLGELVLDAAMDARVTASEHRWVLEVPEEPVTVLGNARQLSQVIVNLLSNARKHTPAGTTVTVRLRSGWEPGSGSRSDGSDSAAPSGSVGRVGILEVIDDGPGIEPEIAGRVFERFTRADAARSGGDGTTGLGLPIVKAIAEAHGGSITLESEPGRTAFILRLPLVAR
ncbi:cell wall metabolism sensor histidine kinase WalK [Brachybacterium sp. ACRRE]|uniref:sensor histidine kinase n=1 Tax=Brachybacterium sp. ACRRE TaxID=2918184 RepID=UPI001EF36CEB|nr:HAMP domain-containing sensor histidine kinase [Brachybacterium sp. ACRRE]MCG7310412.1 HAMP domain-containing histidine kinase [Brachybacterium sp. ACRRE]